jgi:hypothetical protein
MGREKTLSQSKLQHMYKIFIFIWLLLFLGFRFFIGKSLDGDVAITSFYSCDALGIPQDYFPKKTRAYFNVSIRNFSQDPKNISMYLTIQDEMGVPIGVDQRDATIDGDSSAYYIMSAFIPRWAFVGIATAEVSLHVDGVPVDVKSTNFYIGPEDLTPPIINILSPENTTYSKDSVSLVFTVNERTTWIGYSLNNQENVTITGNTTLSIQDNGSYNIKVYANDTSSNTGFSQTVYFTMLIIHDIAIINVQFSSVQAFMGEKVNITVIVQNEGTMTETFNVTAYANTSIIETLVITELSPNKQATIIFVWNTTSWAEGTYSIIAHATPVMRETDTLDNTYAGGIIEILSRPDIRVINVKLSKTIAAKDHSISINVTVENQGERVETFNLSVYANTTRILTELITLAGGNSNIIVTFIWNVTGIPKGNYSISAIAEPLPGEIDLADNIVEEGFVVVSCLGDLNGDYVTDVVDYVLLKLVLPSMPSSLVWNPNADLNDDYKVDIHDFQILKNHIPTIDP